MESINGFTSPPQFIPNADYGLEKQEIKKFLDLGLNLTHISKKSS